MAATRHFQGAEGESPPQLLGSYWLGSCRGSSRVRSHRDSSCLGSSTTHESHCVGSFRGSTTTYNSSGKGCNLQWLS